MPISVSMAWARSSKRLSVSSLTFLSRSSRSALLVWEKLSKADLAADTARSTSALLPNGKVPICSSVAGFKIGMLSLDMGATHSPLM